MPQKEISSGPENPLQHLADQLDMIENATFRQERKETLNYYLDRVSPLAGLLKPEAAELNRKLLMSDYHYMLDMLSLNGLLHFMPTGGIIAQSQEAKGAKIDGSIGVKKKDGKLDGVPSVLKYFNIANPNDALDYAPSGGRENLRNLWKEYIYDKNTLLVRDNPISKPVAVAGLTQGLSIIGELFVEYSSNDEVIVPDLYWENYEAIFERKRAVPLSTYNFFTENGGRLEFNVDGLRQKLDSPGEKKIVLLNFPNNPTGYTPSEREVDSIVSTIKKSAEEDGKEIIVIVDDAYEGFIYDDNAFNQSIFSKLYNLHEKVLAVKIDGASKSHIAYGLRTGFVTYGCKGMTKEVYDILESKTIGAVRADTSSGSTFSQMILEDVHKMENYGTFKEQMNAKFEECRDNYRTVAHLLESKEVYRKHFKPLPFNSGYFLTIKLDGLDANAIRKYLRTQDVGVISENKGGMELLRVNYVSIDNDKLEKTFNYICKSCRDKSRAGIAA